MTRARLIVLGSAAGGGYPQWNCRCPVCSLYWQRDGRVRARTQSSVAVTGDGVTWILLNCSPDVRQQILGTSELNPQRTGRHSPIGAVVLTNGDIDHVAGLLSLRERQSFTIFATGDTLDAIEENRMFAAVDPSIVPRCRIGIGGTIALPGSLEAEFFAVPGKVPLYLEGNAVEVGVETGTTIGVTVRCGDRRFHYVPGCAALTAPLRRRLAGEPLVLFDGTLWRDDEMIAAGVGEKTGRRMGHMPMSGADGSIAAFSDLAVGRKVFVHVNNTNPVLVDGSAERMAAEEAGWTIAHDGLEIEF